MSGAASWLSRRLRRRVAQDWASLRDAVAAGDRRLDRARRDEALALRRDLSALLHLWKPSVPQPAAARLPAGTDWHWRPALFLAPVEPAGLCAPEPGQSIGGQMAIWHDCPHRALSLRQRRSEPSQGDAPFALDAEVLGFEGSYLSLSLDLPDAAREGLSTHQVIRLDIDLSAEGPLIVYGRLNITQGPNVENVLSRLGDPDTGRASRHVAEFDLAYAGLNARPIEKVWLDLIFERPHMNAVTLSDMVISRHPRAEI